MSVPRIFRQVVWSLLRLPLPGYWRGYLIGLGGIKRLIHSGERLRIFIGSNVSFDTYHPELIEIGNGTTISVGSVILSHYPDMRRPLPGFKFYCGRVKIGRNCFIGANTIICKPVSIGDDAVVAAGSIVVCDIPPRQIWGGNPARLIRERER